MRSTVPHTIIVFTSLLLAGSCTRQTPAEELPLARVENHTLTPSDLKEESNLNYFSQGESAERWIDEQVLRYHEELSGVVDHSKMAARLKEYEQQVTAGILIDSLLHQYIRIDPEHIREYYANNLHIFSFPDSAALVTHMGFHNLDAAEEALEVLRAYPAARDSLLTLYNFDRQVVYRKRIIPVLDQAIFSAETDRFYGPLVTDFGYHIILVERFFSQGDTIPFLLVRKLIYEHLFQEQLPLARTTIMDSLREMVDIEIYSD